MRLCLVTTAILVCLTAPAFAETVTCEGSVATVSGGNSDIVKAVCKAINDGETLFEQCNLPPLSAPLHIDIVEEIDPGCVALYHRGEGEIELLAPSAMQDRRDAKGVFANLPIEEYFASIIVHELAHVVYDGVKCPMQTCIATNEYLAYALQFMSLMPERRQAFSSGAALDRSVSIDELNVMILFLAPNIFVRRAWTHILQRENPCEFLGQIVDGNVFLDREMQ